MKNKCAVSTDFLHKIFLIFYIIINVILTFCLILKIFKYKQKLLFSVVLGEGQLSRCSCRGRSGGSCRGRSGGYEASCSVQSSSGSSITMFLLLSRSPPLSVGLLDDFRSFSSNSWRDGSLYIHTMGWRWGCEQLLMLSTIIWGLRGDIDSSVC